MEKKYGLIKASDAKKPPATFSRPSIFNEESSDEEQARLVFLGKCKKDKPN